MSYRGSFFLRALGVLILIGVLLAGGALLFRAGQAQGYQTGIAAGVAASAAAGGETPGTASVTPYGPGYGPAYWRNYPGPHFGFFPFFPFGGLCGSILLVLLVLFALRLIFRPWGWFHHGKGPGGWGEHPHEWGPHGWGPHTWGPPPEPGPGGTKTTADQPAGESSA
ncbi:MAG: hypothetical protein A2W35_14290 [Chloroflexi bacterium RBG_16_57_11]|nr:MAG: hypothetical protein A2W35_14290 [Chloroflexi bacterium RBG_16_57_11]